MSQPDERGHFGEYGGRFVPETLVAALEELEQAYPRIAGDPADGPADRKRPAIPQPATAPR